MSYRDNDEARATRDRVEQELREELAREIARHVRPPFTITTETCEPFTVMIGGHEALCVVRKT